MFDALVANPLTQAPSGDDTQRLSRRRSVIPHVLVALVGLGVFLSVSAFDPEIHHDGVILAPAIGAAQGLQIHSELFSQYGPITTWIQVPAVWLLGPELLSIRIQGAFVLAMSAVLISLLVSRVTRHPAAGPMAALVWVFSSPDWAVTIQELALWPWPSIYYGLVTLLSTWALVVSVGANRSRAVTLATCSGVFVGVACFTRVQLGLLHASIVGLVVLVAWLRQPRGGGSCGAFGMGSRGLLLRIGWGGSSTAGPAGLARLAG